MPDSFLSALRVLSRMSAGFLPTKNIPPGVPGVFRISRASGETRTNINKLRHVHKTPPKNHPTPTSKAVWNPSTMCGKYSAGGRANWLMKHRGLSEADAQEKVMKEFPDQFKSISTTSKAEGHFLVFFCMVWLDIGIFR